MDLSSQASSDEDRVMQRQLYRAGEGNKPAPKTAAPTGIKSSSTAAVPPRAVAKKGKAGSDSTTNGQRILQHVLLLGFGYYLLYGTPEQRKRVYKGLGVAAWLLLLCGVSYCIFLPDLDSLAKELRDGRREIWMDKSLTADQKKDKMRELDEKVSKLSPSQRKQLREIDRKVMTRKKNADMVDFLKKTPEERLADTKKWVDEMEKRRAQWTANRPRNNNKGPGNGRQGPGGPGGGGGGRGGGGGFGGGGGGGGGLPGGDTMSPESRAGGQYRMGLMQKMGGFGGGKGGGGGGGGGR